MRMAISQSLSIRSLMRISADPKSLENGLKTRGKIIRAASDLERVGARPHANSDIRYNEGEARKASDLNI